MPRKQDTINQIFALLGRPAPSLRRGGSVPRLVFEAIIDALDLPVDPSLSMPQAGRKIAELAGLPWGVDCDSTKSPSGGGSTVTLTGLDRLLEAVVILQGRVPARDADLVVGVAYEPTVVTASVPPQPTSCNADPFDAGCAVHVATLDALASYVTSLGCKPLGPAIADPPFDLAWRHADHLVVVEVKTLHDNNRRHQVRLGLGQVLEYRAVLVVRERATIHPVLVTSSPDALGVQVAKSVGVIATSPETWADDLRSLLP